VHDALQILLGGAARGFGLVLQHEHLALERLDAFVVLDVHDERGGCAGRRRLDAVLPGLRSAAALQEVDTARRARQGARCQHQDDSVSRQAVGASGLSPAEQSGRVRQADAVDSAVELRLERFEAFADDRLGRRLCGHGRGDRRQGDPRHQTASERPHLPHLFCDAWRTYPISSLVRASCSP
jgi:hypothetical protein